MDGKRTSFGKARSILGDGGITDMAAACGDEREVERCDRVGWGVEKTARLIRATAGVREKKSGRLAVGEAGTDFVLYGLARRATENQLADWCVAPFALR